MALTQDDRISRGVEERLTSDERTRDAVVQVSTVAGEVTLRGSVDSQAIKDAAEAIARSTAGVTLVVNELVVTTAEQRAEENAFPRVPVAPNTTGQSYGGGFTPGSGQV